MAIDMKKVTKDAQDFKKILVESEKMIKDVADTYGNSLKMFAGMAKTADDLLTRIADGKIAMNARLAELKQFVDLSKTVKTDVDKVLRREAEGGAFLDDLRDNVTEAEKALKADKNNKGLAAKLDLAEKAYQKQMQVYVRINEEYFTVRTVLDGLRDGIGNLGYESHERADAMKRMMEDLVHTVKMIEFSRR